LTHLQAVFGDFGIATGLGTLDGLPSAIHHPALFQQLGDGCPRVRVAAFRAGEDQHCSGQIQAGKLQYGRTGADSWEWDHDLWDILGMGILQR
jgi:hypothetical protein